MNSNKNLRVVPCKKYKYSHKIEDEIYFDDAGNCILSSRRADTEAGSYFLGPTIKKYECSPVTVCLGRKKKTDEYYLMKLLVLDNSNISDRGLYVRRAVFHNEFVTLSMLKHQEGIIQLHEFFKDYLYKEKQGKIQKLKRVCMVMECIFPHGSHNSHLIPLSHFLKEEKLSETEALRILFNLLTVIDKMHKKSVVHREIKLSNIILNKRTLKIKLMDFYYAKIVSSSTESKVKPVFSSHLPKTNDVWAAGVVFYAMLFSGISKLGSLLSSVHSTQDLYLKLEQIKCSLLKNSSISVGTKEILRCILCSLPQYRLKASEALDMVRTLLAVRSSSQNLSLMCDSEYLDQVVPENLDYNSKFKEKSEDSKKSVDSEQCAPQVPEMNYSENKANKNYSEQCTSQVPEMNYSENKANENYSEQCISQVPEMNYSENKANENCDEKENTNFKIGNYNHRTFFEEVMLAFKSHKNNVKFAMMCLGVASLHSITALCFNYF